MSSDRTYSVEAFRDANPDGWELISMNTTTGGQATICDVRHRDGIEGVFRCLKQLPDTKATQRFQREVEAINRVEHPNVIKLLACGLDAPWWYISRKGHRFKTYWNIVRSNSSETEIEELSLQIFRELAEGLAACHQASLVHRDIKTTNIVVMEADRPVIIDFGLAWSDDERDLTEEAEILGNERYSPDYVRKSSEQCPPWVDVFSLVQVLLWMVSEKDVKHNWRRPVHWKYVSFPAGLSTHFVRAVRALGAITSHEKTCPEDGAALLSVIDRFFVTSPIPILKGRAEQEESIRLAVAASLHANATKDAADRDLADACWESARLLYEWVLGTLRQLSDLENVEIDEENSFSELYPREEPFGDKTLIVFRCSHDAKTAFYLRVGIRAFLPSRWRNSGKRPSYLEDTNAFAFTISREGHTAHHTIKFPHEERFFTIEPSGEIALRDKTWRNREHSVSLEELLKIASDLILDPEPWRCISLK